MRAASPADVRAALTAMGCEQPDLHRILRAVANRPARRLLVLQRAGQTVSRPRVPVMKTPIASRQLDWRAAPVHVELPTPPFRWVASRKALVVTAIRNGQITFAEACARFDVSAAEMVDWLCLAAGGEHALRITKRPGDFA